ncbi:MAG: hypothetical protein WCO44_13910 [Bacteroidota bacterium]
MKSTKKSKKALPQVHILGDLKDVKNLIAAVNKKKTLVLFHDAEQDSFYLEIEDEIREIRQKDISRLEKDYRLILFSFFPSRKNMAPAMEAEPEEQQSLQPVADPRASEVKKEKTAKKDPKVKKSKEETAPGKEKKKKKEPAV